MSTHFLIAAPDSIDREKWTGVYGDADGYPRHAGKTLFAQVTGHFQGDLVKAADYYINQHPTGWSGLAVEGVRANACYCHTLGEGTAHTAYETERHAARMEWTYILRAEGLDIRKYGEPFAVVPWDQEDTVWETLGRR